MPLFVKIIPFIYVILRDGQKRWSGKEDTYQKVWMLIQI